MSAQLPKPGDTIGGQFVLRRELGRGAHGVVFEAQQLGLERQVAIKMLLPEVLEDDGIVERFKREARLASALSSPHSVIIHAFGVHTFSAPVQELPYLAMEYLHGEDLACYLRRVGTLTVEQTTVILRQVLASLAEAHRKGIVHRDLKPENIFLSQRDATFIVKVLDFGIAKAIADTPQGQGRRLTADGMVCGTPEYMAPEQAKGLPEITPAVDVYAVGCIIYHMLAGRPPFLGPTPMTIALKHCQDPPPKLPPSVKSPFFRDVVGCALSKEPRERYRDASELLAVVEEHYAASLGPGASGSWRAAEPPSQEFGLQKLPPSRASLEGAVPDWALTTSPSMNAFRAPGEAAEAVDLPAQGRFPVAVGEHIDAGFFVESAEQPTILDFDEPEPLEAPLPLPMSSGRPTEGNASTLQVPILGASARSRADYASSAPSRPEEATERRIFLALALGAGVIFLLLMAGLGVLFLLPSSGEPAAPTVEVVEVGANVRLSVASSPSGAQVFEGEELLGETPLLVERPRADATVTLTLRRAGYKDAAVELSLKRNSVHNMRLQRLAGDGWADQE